MFGLLQLLQGFCGLVEMPGGNSRQRCLSRCVWSSLCREQWAPCKAVVLYLLLNLPAMSGLHVLAQPHSTVTEAYGTVR